MKDRLNHKGQIALYELWRKQAAGRALPDAAGIRPPNFPALFEQVALIEVERDAARLQFQFRFAGPKMILRMGQDPIGRWLEEVLAPEDAAQLRIALVETTALKRPQLVKRPVPLDEFHERYQEDLLLPCIGRDGLVELVILHQTFAEGHQESPTQRGVSNRAIGGLFDH